MKEKNGGIEYPFVHGQYAFRTPRDRCLYIGTSLRHQPKWLKDHADAWKFRCDLQQDVSADLSRAENAAPPDNATVPRSLTSIREVQSDDQQDGTSAVGFPSSDETTVRRSTPATEPPLADAELSPPRLQDEIVMGGRRYVSAKRFAAMRGISLRTLSRICESGDAPPKIKINGNYFELPEPSD